MVLHAQVCGRVGRRPINFFDSSGYCVEPDSAPGIVDRRHSPPQVLSEQGQPAVPVAQAAFEAGLESGFSREICYRLGEGIDD